MQGINVLKSRYPNFPTDIPLALPKSNNLKPEDQHFLIYIPWNDAYINLIPGEYRQFFLEVLPYLQARTTDVHTAVCLQYLDEFIQKAQLTGTKVKRNVVAYALILHDSGWSQMSEQEIAASLGVSGLVLSQTATAPKEKHALLGEKIARQILTEKQIELSLSDSDIDLICKAIHYHDKPEKVAGAHKEIPIEVQLLVDLDHIWSFTHFNFWQDVLRKGVEPKEYLANLGRDLDGYFVTRIGKEKARLLLVERESEINAPSI